MIIAFKTRHGRASRLDWNSAQRNVGRVWGNFNHLLRHGSGKGGRRQPAKIGLKLSGKTPTAPFTILSANQSRTCHALIAIDFGEESHPSRLLLSKDGPSTSPASYHRPCLIQLRHGHHPRSRGHPHHLNVTERPTPHEIHVIAVSTLPGMHQCFRACSH